MRKFIEKAVFEPDYFYMILSYGNKDSVAAYRVKNFVKVNYIQTIKMVDNDSPVFDMKEQKTIDKKEGKQIRMVIKNIQKGVQFIPTSIKEGLVAYEMLSQKFYEHSEMNNGSQL